ncbi:MAG: hypothetical protein D6830_04230 [Ignavibacteria bacterium]|nr:MAG: hypothetical protein D6830_04230 [Ignavibacteria bacterium]
MISKTKIGMISFLLLLGLVTLFYFSMDLDKEINIKFVEVEGNRYLEKDTYMSFARLNNENALEGITLGMIKDRFEKHPYIKYVDVIYEGNGKVNVTLYERNFREIVISDGNEYLVDENLSISPLLSFTKNIDLPIIIGIDKIKNKAGRKSIKLAAQLLDAAELSDPQFAADIAEIELASKGNVIIRFLYNDFELRLGNEDLIYKTAAFGSFYSKLNADQNVKQLEYIDMRFENQLCLGFETEIPSNGEGRS